MRAARVRIVGIGALTTLVLAACSGTYLATQSDAGTTSIDASLPGDAGLDASPLIVADAGLDADAAPNSICARPNLFCDDFDDPVAAVGARWSTLRQGAGPFDLDDKVFSSPGRSLRLQLVSAKGNRESAVGKDIDLPSGNFQVSFDLRIDPAATGTFGEIAPLILTLRPPPADVTVQQFAISTYPGSTKFEAYRRYVDGGRSAPDISMPFTLRAFQRITLAVKSSDGKVVGTISVDGSAPVSQTFVSSPPTKITLDLGAPYTFDAEIATSLRFDNVLVEAL